MYTVSLLYCYRGNRLSIVRDYTIACKILISLKKGIFTITKTRLFKYMENFTSRNWKFSDKNLWLFSYFSLNIDCGYSLEPPRRGRSNGYPQSMFSRKNKKNNVYRCKPQLYYIKVGFKGLKIIKACFLDARNVALIDLPKDNYRRYGRMKEIEWAVTQKT